MSIGSNDWTEASLQQIWRPKMGFCLPAGGNCRQQQILDLRQAGVKEASKEKGAEEMLSMRVIMSMNAKGMAVTFRCLLWFQHFQENKGLCSEGPSSSTSMSSPLQCPFLLFKAPSTQTLSRQLLCSMGGFSPHKDLPPPCPHHHPDL